MKPSSRTPLPPLAARNHRILFLQSSSVIERTGPTEYYQDDLLSIASEIYSPANVHALIRRRSATMDVLERPYRMTLVQVAATGLLGKIQDKFSLAYAKASFHTANLFRPTLVIAGSLDMAPTALSLSLKRKIPWLLNLPGTGNLGALRPPYSWCLKQAKGILASGQTAKERLVSYGIAEDRVRVIPPRLPSAYEKFPPPRRAKGDEEPFTLLSIFRNSADESIQAQDHVLQAIFRLRQGDPTLPIRYIIHGDVAHWPHFEELATEMKILDLVEHLPRHTSGREFESVYRKADVLVSPSLAGDDLGVSFLESAAFGLPTISYRNSPAVDFIKHGVNGLLVEPDNIAELASAIHSLTSDRQQHFELARKAHEIVMEGFTGPAIRKYVIAALDRF